MTKKTTDFAQVNPCCYCCLSEDTLTEKSNGRGLTYWLCEKCLDAGFQWIENVRTLVCPTHGARHHYDVENVEYYQRWASKKKHYYDCPVKTRYAKENGKAAQYLLKYDERKPE